MHTQQHARTTDSLGRYYTSASVSQLLVNQLPCIRPSAVLDLGSGHGALSIAASARWSDSDLITVDVDDGVSATLSHRLQRAGFKGGHAHLFEDALAPDLPSLLPGNLLGMPEIGICNPPFLVPKWRKAYGAILEDVGLSGCLPAIAATDATVLFLAQNLRMIAPGGHIGIIVPDSLVSADKYIGFRTELLARYAVRRAIRLPRGSFGGTDALAHIIVISKDRPTSETVELARFDQSCGLSPLLRVDMRRAAGRLEHNYHLAQGVASYSGIRLASVCTDLRRGALNSAQARQSDGFVLHTTNISEDMHGHWIDFSAKKFRAGTTVGRAAVAIAGDIVVARVGRRAAKKVIGIAKGSVVFTDCLYRLRVPEQHRHAVLANLTSNCGRQWLEQHAYGVAASHLKKLDLLNLPLELI